MEKPNGYRWLIVVIVLFILGLFSIFVAAIAGLMATGDVVTEGNVALIKVNGVILADSESSFFSSEEASSTKIVRYIDEASADPMIKAIVIEINSPGGSPVASDEIASAIKRSDKPVIALIREVGASGGYYVASACNPIIAHKMSVTGSIGVIGSYLSFEGLMDDYNVSYNRLTAGKYKDMGSPYKNLTLEERIKMQSLVDGIYDIFVDEVAENRNLSRDYVRTLATGEVFLGRQAKELGLIDMIGGKPELTAYLENTLNITVEYAEYKEQTGFFDMFSASFNENSYYIGKGIGESIMPENKIVMI